MLEDLEAITAEASTSDDPTLPKLKSNARVVNEVQVEHHLENSKDTNGEVVVGKSKDEKSDSKFEQDLIENDDDEAADVKDEVFNVSDRDSIAKADGEIEEQLNHELAPKVLNEDENFIAEADDKFKANLTKEFIKANAEIECRKVRTKFEGTFLDNYEDILENLEKFVGENEREDALCIAILVEENEMKENDSKFEGSRYEIKPVNEEETLADVKDKPSPRDYQDLSMLVVCLMQIILSMLNTLLNVRKQPSCASSMFPSSEMLSKPMPLPIIQEKLLTVVADSIKMDLAEDVMEDEIASADNFMVQ